MRDRLLLMVILLHDVHLTGISQIKWCTRSVLLISARPLWCSKSPPFACPGRRLLPALRIGSTAIVYLLPREVVKKWRVSKMHFSLSLRLCYTAFQPFCGRAAAGSEGEMVIFVVGWKCFFLCEIRFRINIIIFNDLTHTKKIHEKLTVRGEEVQP